MTPLVLVCVCLSVCIPSWGARTFVQLNSVPLVRLGTTCYIYMYMFFLFLTSVSHGMGLSSSAATSS